MNNRPATLAEVARRVNRGEQRYDLALPEFLDEFYGSPNHRQRMIEQEPEAFDDPIRHAYFGGIGEHLARRWGLAIPAWTSNPTRFLKRPFFNTPFEALKAMYLAESPIAFRRRLIFTEAEPLHRARMPRDKQPAAGQPSPA